MHDIGGGNDQRINPRLNKMAHSWIGRSFASFGRTCIKPVGTRHRTQYIRSPGRNLPFLTPIRLVGGGGVPVLAAIQEISARMGRTTGRGHCRQDPRSLLTLLLVIQDNVNCFRRPSGRSSRPNAL
jgi:hypothetical protein